MDERNVIIYHGGCPDGYGAAWWLARHLEREAPTTKHAAQHGEPLLVLPNLQGADVWIVDFCYEPDALHALAETARTVTVFDHHQTAAGWFPHPTLSCYSSIFDFVEVERLGGLDRVSVVIDQSRSGVGLVGQYVRSRWGTEIPEFLLHVEDRDLWKFELPNTQDVVTAVAARRHVESEWDYLLDAPIEVLVLEGEAINRYRERLIEASVTNDKIFALFLHGEQDSEWNIPCVTAPYMIGSDVAGQLAELDPDAIGAYAIGHGDHVQIGLRSRKDGPDVAAIAQRYGGGGHRNAAGLRLSWQQFFQLMRPVG